MAEKNRSSTGFRLIAFISIAVGGYFTFAMMLMARMYLTSLSGASILTVLSGLALMIAGLTALMSVEIGCYVYIASCAIWLLRFVPVIFLKSTFFGEIALPVSGIVVIVLGMTAIPFWLSLFGVILSHYEMKKSRNIFSHQKST